MIDGVWGAWFGVRGCRMRGASTTTCRDIRSAAAMCGRSRRAGPRPCQRRAARSAIRSRTPSCNALVSSRPSMYRQASMEPTPPESTTRAMLSGSALPPRSSRCGGLPAPRHMCCRDSRPQTEAPRGAGTTSARSSGTVRSRAATRTRPSGRDERTPSRAHLASAHRARPRTHPKACRWWYVWLGAWLIVH